MAVDPTLMPLAEGASAGVPMSLWPAIIVAVGSITSIPFFRLLFNRMDAADKVWRERVERLENDNKDLHEKLGERDSDYRKLHEDFQALKADFKILKSEYATIVLADQTKQAEIIRLNTIITKRDLTIEQRDKTIKDLKDEYDSDMVRLGQPTKYEDE